MSQDDINEQFEHFVATIARLRAPDGCPWDKAQTHKSIARNMIEEAYEALDAIERGDMIDLREELGDVLLQVVLHSQMAKEAGAFDIADVVRDVTNKMVRRHPHVFGDDVALAAAGLTRDEAMEFAKVSTPGEVLDLWDSIKLYERQVKAAYKAKDVFSAVNTVGTQSTAGTANTTGAPNAPSATGTTSAPTAPAPTLLDSVPQSLPALMQAQDISRKAVSAGFEWPDVQSVWQQVASEIEEFKSEPAGSDAATLEFGDVLFSLVNVARKDGIDAESALRASCSKFRKRWAIMEQYANAQGLQIESLDLEALEILWTRAKADESLRQ